MALSRREFVTGTTVSLFGAQALYGKRVAAQASPPSEDGYRLWLRYAPLEAAQAAPYRSLLRRVFVEGTSPTSIVTRAELITGLTSLLGGEITRGGPQLSDGALVVGTPAGSARIRALGWGAELDRLGPEGFVVRSARVEGRPAIVIASAGDVGALYGAFHLLRLVQTVRPLARVNVAERPRLQLRLLNHWDNLNGTIERGYAGRSLWQWADLPGTVDPRYTDYARANASVGINGAVINNVNANELILSTEYLAKVAALARVFRPYGMKIYLSANFAAPVRLGKLATADPLDPGVAAWWKAKADEIYTLIPDFGGFCVKANSEGQPGPKDYKRTHAEGANVLADAVAPHGGHIMWRAFIYDEDVDPDRAKRAYLEFMKLDGQFRPNVVVQVKNGAIDFQPREPFHPLFGALKSTPVIAEIQPTQEYLGHARHLVYLGPMWEEFLKADTHAKGRGSTVGRSLDGSVHPYRVTGMVAVANPGLDRNWCGHHFSQANWYAAGRLAWNHELTAAAIADEWTRQTFGNHEATVRTITGLMMGSHETFVRYTMPLGLHHLIGGDHYAPMPENARAPRADWTAVYYHQASKEGIGFDRTMRGNRAVDQYFPPVRDRFDNLATCPEAFLLWFHRLPWTHKVRSGRTLWDELVRTYHQGAAEAAAMQVTWQSLAGRVDPQRHREVAERLAIQVTHAAEWRDQILKYFAQFSGGPVTLAPTA
jgi:alpha-glucuronidase